MARTERLVGSGYPVDGSFVQLPVIESPGLDFVSCCLVSRCIMRCGGFRL